MRELRREDFDFVFDLHRNLRSWVVTACLKKPFARISKFRFRELVLYFFRKGGYRVFFQSSLDRSREALRVVGGTALPPGQQTNPGARAAVGVLPAIADVRLTQAFGSGFVCIAAESAWPQKEWSIERFIEVAHWVAERGLGVVWLGLRPLPEAAKFSGALDLTAKLSLEQVAAVLAQAKVLVCNDSGLMHLSEAAGTPVVAVFGPTSRELGFAPRMERSVIVEKNLWCRPCSKTGRFCIRLFERRKCLTDISVRDVVDALERMLPAKELR